MATGKIKQVVGPTLDIEFPSDQLPDILNAIRIRDRNKNIDITAEVAQHISAMVAATIRLGI